MNCSSRLLFSLAALCLSSNSLFATQPEVLFEDDFNRGIPGWTAVQPPGNYIDGPMRWQYDIVSHAYLEQSNIYTDAPGGSTNATAVMLINDAETAGNFTYTARLIAGDDDAFGLIFGYDDPQNFYRVTFSRQDRTGEATPAFPYTSWLVDRKVDGVATNLFGWPTAGYFESFRNTRYQPFDVTISVQDGLFSLTVVDDPEGLQIEYPLVVDQSLPGSPDGQVGLMSWGMGGSAVRGFRISNPTLQPGGLVGDPNVLQDWTPVVTPRADGTGLDTGTGNGGVPIWSLALGPDGELGTLHENSDSFGGNTAEGRIDFPAAALVAGDVSWTDYVFSTRIIPGDDDGHGILVRYQNETNFYRIALRAQNSGSGIKRGVSIQKVVDGVWEEIFSEETPQFVPANNVPFEISALMIGDRLQVLLVADPEGAATRYNYGPFDLTGDTLAHGRIGLFSWAMAPAVQFDWVRVVAVDGVPLQVTSEFGTPTPPVGVTGYEPDSEIIASVESPVDAAPGVRHVATGWVGTGSVPASGTENTVTFSLNEISSLTWLWRTEYNLQVTSTTGGTVSGAPGDWVTADSSLTLHAEADSGYVFAGWTGGTFSTSPTLDFILNRPVVLEARFEADDDADQLPDSWEQAWFEGLAETGAGDPDADGSPNSEELRRGTNPTSPETLAFEDGLSSPWENVQRDPVLPGRFLVTDFGAGFRGAWDNSNDFRGADDSYYGTNAVPNVSFDGPRMIISEEVWQTEWSNSTASAIFSVGDNDGVTVYFRYQDEMNWYRVTVTGEDNNALWRAKYGVSIQKRVNGVFTEIAELPQIATDPTDTAYYKRIMVTVTADGSLFEVQVVGWNVFVTPPDWDPLLAVNYPFFDEDLATGRFGVGTWGQGGGNTATDTNPVGAGALVEDVLITMNDQQVFQEDWAELPLETEIPAGWENPYTGAQAGNWVVTAHGSILQTANFGLAATGAALAPTTDAEGSILLAPEPEGGLGASYLLELGFHPFDNDGIGFVYDFQDTNNFSRVLFVSEATADGRVPQGVSVSRKSAGVWTDLLAGDNTFIYESGSPFAAELSSNNGQYHLLVWPMDDPGNVRTYSWTAPASTSGNRVGLATWGETDAHFLYARVYNLAPGDIPPAEFELAGISIANDVITLTVNKTGDVTYAVEQSTTLAPDSWTTVAENLTENTWSTPLPQEAGHAFYRIRVDNFNQP